MWNEITYFYSYKTRGNICVGFFVIVSLAWGTTAQIASILILFIFRFQSILEYERYLKEVVSALESDPDFRQKLDNASEIDVRVSHILNVLIKSRNTKKKNCNLQSGKIAHELEYVNHHVRTKLDEIKRREIERLRLMAIKQVKPLEPIV